MYETTIIRRRGKDEFKVAARNGEPIAFASHDEALHYRDTYVEEIKPMKACVAKLGKDQHILIVEFLS
jgi:hypothetical protein